MIVAVQGQNMKSERSKPKIKKYTMGNREEERKRGYESLLRCVFTEYLNDAREVD